MTDLTIAGSVAGLISLGIQCRDGLTRYYFDYRLFSDEIHHISQHIVELGNHLS